ncbi:MAG: hypothetical protein Q9221_007145 [Calogaya cf. arnoldii]
MSPPDVPSDSVRLTSLRNGIVAYKHSYLSITPNPRHPTPSFIRTTTSANPERGNLMMSSSSNNKENNNPKASNPSKPTSNSKPTAKQGPTSHPSTSTQMTKTPIDSGGPATAAYKSAQKKIPPRESTPHGSEAASSQACESADVSESERGVMRRERKDVMHQAPGGEFEARGGR